MKKFIKSLTVACLAILLVCPLAFAGCSKNYTINISIVSGEGQVYKKDYLGISVLGNNTVKKGDKFEYFIEPATGYEIAKIEIDGNEYTQAYDKTGAYLDFEQISANHNVKVTFGYEQWTLNFMCMGDDDQFTLYKSIDVVVNAAINLNLAEYGGQDNSNWFVEKTINGATVYVYLCNDNTDPSVAPSSGYEVNMLFVRQNNLNVYTNLTRAQLDALKEASGS